MLRRLPRPDSGEARAYSGEGGAKGPAHQRNGTSINWAAPRRKRRNMPTSQAKPFEIPKQLEWEAYRQVAANRGAGGVDGQDLEVFGADLKGNLYKIWNRMSSGSYFPPPVRAVEIPKRTEEASARSASRRSADRARRLKPNKVSESVVVTHPFHPLSGQRVEVLFERRQTGGVVLSCDCGPLGRMWLPANWTDRARVEQPTKLSYEVLVELAAVMVAIGGRDR